MKTSKTRKSAARKLIVEPIEFSDCDGTETSKVEVCSNYGCDFNESGACKSNGTHCYGYIELKADKK